MHLVAVGILWIALGVLFVVSVSTVPDGPVPFATDASVRLGVVTPLLLGVVLAIWWGVPPFARECLVTIASIVAPASMILGVTLAQQGDIAANRGALTIVLLFITVVVRLRFWFAVVACLTLVTVQVGVPQLLGIPVAGSVPLALITIAVTLAGNYSLERESRLNYLHGLRARIQGAQLSELVSQLHELSQRDALTGLANRRAMDSVLADLSARNEPFALILVDVDGFKAFNDCYGHQVGDDCLRRVAAILRASLRFTTDRIARMGGEEFAVVLPQTKLEAAQVMAERMRRSVAELRIPHADSPTGSVVSISAGVSASTGNKASADVVAAADKALYRAKLSGRNRVELGLVDRAESVARGIRVAASA